MKRTSCLKTRCNQIEEAKPRPQICTTDDLIPSFNRLLRYYRKFYRREMYLEDVATRSGDPDDLIIGRTGRRGSYCRTQWEEEVLVANELSQADA
jgi:hypothetical protein